MRISRMLMILSLGAAVGIACGPAVEFHEPNDGTCGPQNCAGCCDANGICQSLSDDACGLAGAQCVSCTGATPVCDQSTRQCTAARDPNASPEDHPQPGACTDAEQCPSFSCACPDGTTWTSRHCFNGSCQGETATCQNACEDHQKPPPVTEYQYGCTLSRFSNDFNATVNYFGAGSTETAARNAVLNQCRSTNFNEAFCSGASISCTREVVEGSSCTWSKFSESAGTTIYYYGEGTSRTDAKRDTVDQCLSSGRWQGWFCGSGTLSCS